MIVQNGEDGVRADIVGGAPVDADGTRAVCSQHDVLRHREVRAEREFLRNHCDAGSQGVHGRCKPDPGAVPEQLAGIRRQLAADDVHQRRFAGAVFTDHRVYLGSTQIDADIPQRLMQVETLAEHYRTVRTGLAGTLAPVCDRTGRAAVGSGSGRGAWPDAGPGAVIHIVFLLSRMRDPVSWSIGMVWFSFSPSR